MIKKLKGWNIKRKVRRKQYATIDELTIIFDIPKKYKKKLPKVIYNPNADTSSYDSISNLITIQGCTQSSFYEEGAHFLTAFEREEIGQKENTFENIFDKIIDIFYRNCIYEVIGYAASKIGEPGRKFIFSEALTMDVLNEINELEKRSSQLIRDYDAYIKKGDEEIEKLDHLIETRKEIDDVVASQDYSYYPDREKILDMRQGDIKSLEQEKTRVTLQNFMESSPLWKEFLTVETREIELRELYSDPAFHVAKGFTNLFKSYIFQEQDFGKKYDELSKKISNWTPISFIEFNPDQTNLIFHGIGYDIGGELYAIYKKDNQLFISLIKDLMKPKEINPLFTFLEVCKKMGKEGYLIKYKEYSPNKS